jgi:hypothetical protein
MNELNDDQLFEELLNLKVEVVSDIDDAESMPIYDEYFSSKVFDLHSDEFDYIEDTETKASDSPCWDGYKQIGMKRGKSGKMVPNCVPMAEKSAKQKLKDPKGGLTSAGRAFFKRTEGSDLKPGVKGAADTPEKMRRKGSFLTRFFTNPSGPMVDEKGRATRLALSATAWGERVPKNAEDAAKLAEKGRKLLERYGKTKKKDDLESVEEKQLPGQTIGQQGGGAIGAQGSTAPNGSDATDHDGDGMIFDGTPQEQRKRYERSKNDDYEKKRRKYVKEQLRRQGIKGNRRLQDRSEEERNARARARAAFDKVSRDEGGSPIIPKDKKPADRYSPSVPKPEPRSVRPEDGVQNRTKPSPKSPATTRPGADRSEPRTSPSATRPGADRSEPKPSDRKPADRYPNPERPASPGDGVQSRPKPSTRPVRPEDGVQNRPKPSTSRPNAGRPTIDRPRRPINRRTTGENRNIRDF